MSGPLEGIRIVDLTHVLNGPFATMLLAHMGADVIKIEHGKGDRFRHSWMPVDSTRDGYEYLAVNANKRCITLNLKSDRGRDIFRQLVKVSDVVVANSSVRAMKQLGLNYEDLKQINPRIVFAKSTGYGSDGPYADLPAFAATIRAISGWTDTAWEATNVEGMKDLGIGDEAAGISLALGVCAALVARERSGQGQEVEVAMQEAQLGLMVMCLHTLFEGQPVGAAPAKCMDGYFSFHIKDMSDAIWQRLARAMDHSEVLDDPRFVDAEARRNNDPELEAMVREWIRTRTRQDLWDIFFRERIPCAPVLSVGEAVEDENLKARDSFVNIEHEDAGTLKLLEPWIHFSRTPTSIRHAGVAIGFHNREVYGGILGLNEDEIDALEAEGAV